MASYLWENGLRANINVAFDPIVFPERLEIAQRNVESALRRQDYTIHLLDKMLPLDNENPRYQCYTKNTYYRVSYSQRCRCRLGCNSTYDSPCYHQC